MKRFETIRQLDSNNGTIRRLARDHEFAGQVVDTLYIPRGAASDKVNYLQLLKQIKNVLPLHGCQQCVQFHEVFLTPRYLGLVMEHVEGNLLSDFLMKRGESLDEVTTRKLFHQLISGVSFIHGRDKTHRNISLATLAVDESGAEPALKILTFEHMSIADSLSSIQSNPLAGSALYTPPEVFLNSVNPEQAAEDVTGAFDVWSCGIVLYLMLYGSHPFLPLGAEQLNPAETVTVMIENSVKGMIQFPGLSSISDLSTDLLRRILVPATHKRYTVSQILSHPWLSSIQLPEPSAIIPLRQPQAPEIIRSMVKEAVKVMDPQSVLLSSNLSDIVAMSDSLRNSSELQGGSNTSSHNNSIKKNSLCSRPTPTYPDQHMQLVGIQPFNSQGSIQHPRQGVGPSLELFTRPSPFEQSAGPPSSGSYPPLTSMPPPQLGQRLPLFVELPAIQPLYHLALSAPSPQQLQEDIDVLQAQLHIRQFNASLYQARMEQERLLSMHLPNYNLNGNQQ